MMCYTLHSTGMCVPGSQCVVDLPFRSQLVVEGTSFIFSCFCFVFSASFLNLDLIFFLFKMVLTLEQRVVVKHDFTTILSIFVASFI